MPSQKDTGSSLIYELNGARPDWISERRVCKNKHQKRTKN